MNDTLPPPLIVDNQFPEARAFVRAYHVVPGEDCAITEISTRRQEALARNLLGLLDVFRQSNNMAAMGALSTVMVEFAGLFPEFLRDPHTDPRLVSSYPPQAAKEEVE